jgi:hypothetical protein
MKIKKAHLRGYLMNTWIWSFQKQVMVFIDCAQFNRHGTVLEAKPLLMACRLEVN